jgi:hypothetical protein
MEHVRVLVVRRAAEQRVVVCCTAVRGRAAERWVAISHVGVVPVCRFLSPGHEQGADRGFGAMGSSQQQQAPVESQQGHTWGTVVTATTSPPVSRRLIARSAPLSGAIVASSRASMVASMRRTGSLYIDGKERFVTFESVRVART